MGAFKDLRNKLAADLQVVGVPVIDDWLVRAEPPCIFLTPPMTNNYVSEGKEFAALVFNIDVVVLVNVRPSASKARDELENLLENVLRNTVDWALTGVDPPGTASLPDSTIEFLGTVVHLGKSVVL